MYAPDEVYLPPGITLSLICPSICIFGFSVLINQMEKRRRKNKKHIVRFTHFVKKNNKTILPSIIRYDLCDCSRC